MALRGLGPLLVSCDRGPKLFPLITLLTVEEEAIVRALIPMEIASSSTLFTRDNKALVELIING